MIDVDEGPRCEFSFLFAAQCGHCLGHTLPAEYEEVAK